MYSKTLYSNDDLYISLSPKSSHIMYQLVTSKPALAEQSLTSHAEVTYYITNNNVYAEYKAGFLHNMQ